MMNIIDFINVFCVSSIDLKYIVNPFHKCETFKHLFTFKIEYLLVHDLRVPITDELLIYHCKL
jgi:hypothetical protein